MKLKPKERFIFLKNAEELNELSTKLLQAVNKPNKTYYNKICLEVLDVKKQLEILELVLNMEYNYPCDDEGKLVYGKLDA
tara:strand:+ start:305 stop:544 length:240 start_codon:yes stop_codon:yes gene_type:complete